MRENQNQWKSARRGGRRNVTVLREAISQDLALPKIRKKKRSRVDFAHLLRSCIFEALGHEGSGVHLLCRVYKQCVYSHPLGILHHQWSGDPGGE